MAPLTKRKYAKSRQRERRGHLKIPFAAINDCPQCHNAKLSHHACPTCGYYNGREAIKIETPKKKTS
jgi:large subunit ribosomal protein L32